MVWAKVVQLRGGGIAHKTFANLLRYIITWGIFPCTDLWASDT